MQLKNQQSFFFAKRKQLVLFLSLFFIINYVQSGEISIELLGAIPNINAVTVCQKNAQIFQNGFKLLNNTNNVLVVDENKSYCMHPIILQNVNNMTLKISGNILASQDIDYWPIVNNKSYQNLFQFNNCTNITLTGQGLILGYGYDWWLGSYTGKHNLYNLSRPNLINLQFCQNFLFEQFTMWDSPQYNIFTSSTNNCEFRDMFILVNTTKQRELFLLFDNITQFSQLSIPLFPLNTDGIDPSGQNYYIHNVTIKNFDDAVAVKPGHQIGTGCASNMLIENSKVIFGVGMTIGSVPPKKSINCVENITFSNIEFIAPIKGIYVKTNSGDPNGTGFIKNIVYSNLTMTDAIWYSIYIGPQQQKQPNGGGDGWWPPSQPLITIDNITITNVSSKNALFFKYGAGVLRCNITNPCKNFDFQNLLIQGWAIKNWCCENIYGYCQNCTPAPYCIQPMDSYSIEHQRLIIKQDFQLQQFKSNQPQETHFEYRPYEQIKERILQIEEQSNQELAHILNKITLILQFIEQNNSKIQITI